MAILRRLKDDFREYPATMSFGMAWLVVFVAMVVEQYVSGQGLSKGMLLGGLRNGHRFGDLTLRELYAGEYWRTITATFVHFGALHIGMNLWALYQLGCLVESWYGSGPFVAIYLITGGGGNLLSGIIRQTLRSNPSIASGGGSTVIMGLVGLCAVVGWRARTRIGDHLRNQMIWVFCLTEALGFGLSNAGLPVIDNWGHTGGTIMGAVLGLANRDLVRLGAGLLSQATGWLGVVVLTACAFAQVADDRAEGVLRKRFVEQAKQRSFASEILVKRLEEIRELYGVVVKNRVIVRGTLFREVPRRPKPIMLEKPAAEKPTVSQTNPPMHIDPDQELFYTVLNVSLKSLMSMAGELEAGPTSADYRTARHLLAKTLAERPTQDEVRDFDARMSLMIDRLKKDRESIMRDTAHLN